MTTHALPTRGRGRVIGLLHGEWTKLWSVRATWLSLGVALVLQATVAASLGASYANEALEAELAGLPLAMAGTAGVQVAQMALVALALLAVTTEFSTGSIAPSLQAVARRPRLVLAKVAVVGLVCAVAGAVVVLAGAATAWLAAGVFDHGGIGWILADPWAGVDPTGLGHVVGRGALYVLLVSTMTVGIATLLRSAVATLVTVLALLLVLPEILTALSIAWLVTVGEHLPGAAAAALLGDGPYDTARGVVVLVAWAVVAVATGIVGLHRRDA